MTTTGGMGGLLCFSADTLVHTSQGKDVRMDELTLNDWVLSKQGSSVCYYKNMKIMFNLEIHLNLYKKFKF